MTVSKVFNSLKRLKIIQLENPMETVALPGRGNLVRTRIPTVEEVRAILFVVETPMGHSPICSPVHAIIRFAILTGARIGKILHAEWNDFDLHQGIWRIRNKPNCPGIEGMGWSPKWQKERSIKLFPEALSLLLSLPHYETVGFIRDENGPEIAIPAQFVFPKRQVKIKKDCPMQLEGLLQMLQMSLFFKPGALRI